jgi:hypothetical protein
MKNLRAIILIAGILVAGIAFNTVAQTSDKMKPANEQREFKQAKHKHKNKDYKMHKDFKMHKDYKIKHKPHDKIHKDKHKDKNKKARA